MTTGRVRPNSSAQSAPASEDIARTLKPFAPIDSVYQEGSWQEADDHEAQSFAQAMSQSVADFQ